jgi:hypothetical protein
VTIHLLATPTNSQKDLPYLRSIAQAIHENGDELALPWFEDTHPNNAATLEAYNEATAKADLLIVEASHYSFDTGLFTALATQNKKPTLLVSRNPLDGRSISGISSQYLTCRTYKTAAELALLTTQFLQDNTLDAQDLRFNFFIDRQIYSYLRNKSYETGKNKSEIIRELLEREIREKTA